jgi:hypothetical protein
MNKELNKVRFDGFKKSWEDSQTWEMGQEGPSATDRGSFKTGYLNGFDDGFKAAIDFLSSDKKPFEKLYEAIFWANWLYNLFKEKQDD